MKGETKAVIVSVIIAISLWILIFQGLAYLSSLPLKETAPEPTPTRIYSLPRKIFALAEVTYSPDWNLTHVQIDNISGRELYLLAVISESGQIDQMPTRLKPGKEVPEPPKLARWDRIGFFSFSGKISRITIQFSFEFPGEVLEETLEWTW